MRLWAGISNWSHRECVKPSCRVTVVSAKHLSEPHFRGKGKRLYWLHLFVWQDAWLLKHCQITLGNPARWSPTERWGSQCMHARKPPVTTTTLLTRSHLPWFSKYWSYRRRRGGGTISKEKTNQNSKLDHFLGSYTDPSQLKIGLWVILTLQSN